MLQRLPIALAQVKSGNMYDNLLKKIHQSIYFCIEQNKSYKIIIQNGHYIYSANSKALNPHRLLVFLSDKINFKRSDKYVVLSNFASTIHGVT